MPQGVKADQRKLDWRRIKCVGFKHPSGNEPFLATLGDHSKMAFPVAIFFAQDNDNLSMERMIGITDLDPRSLMMGSMLSLRLPDLRRYSPISRVTHTGSPSQTAGWSPATATASPSSTKTTGPKARIAKSS